MKKILLFAALTAFCGVACAEKGKADEKDNSEGKTDVNVIGKSPVSASETVAAFFETQLPSVSGYRSDCFFVDEGQKKVICLTINSVKQLKDIMRLSIEPPAIDFDTHTLVIGQVEVGGSGYTISAQTLDVKTGAATLNLTVKKPEASYEVMCPLYFWGLYPRFTAGTINVNVVE